MAETRGLSVEIYVLSTAPYRAISLGDGKFDGCDRGATLPDMTETQRAITREIYIALERLGASRDLLATVGSWGDTLDEDDVLTTLRDINAGRGGFQSTIGEPKKH